MKPEIKRELDSYEDMNLNLAVKAKRARLAREKKKAEKADRLYEAVEEWSFRSASKEVGMRESQ